jgi:AraC family transcriptional regulator
MGDLASIRTKYQDTIGGMRLDCHSDMDYLTRIQRAIDYIEEHLKEELPTEQIARAAYFSMWHFQRVFGAIVGLGVKEYVRKRRLTQAMRDLAETDRRIVDIAFDYQFESQESFTRAFKAHCGLTPAECRKRGIGSKKMHHRPKVTMEYLSHIHGEMDMEPKFIELPEQKVVGMGAKFVSILSPDRNNFNVIPALWGQFMSRIGEIKHRKGELCFGLVEMLPEGEDKSHIDEMFYIACAEVSNFDAVPPGMIHRVIPMGRYACFSHKGKLDRLEHTMNFIHGSWVPKSNVRLREAPELELYDERFIPDSDNSEFDILLPIR